MMKTTLASMRHYCPNVPIWLILLRAVVSAEMRRGKARLRADPPFLVSLSCREQPPRPRPTGEL
jgi:hypothetical protein